MSEFGSSSNTSKGFNEISRPDGGGVSMDTSKTMYGGTNTPMPQGDPKATMINTGQNNPTTVARADSEDATLSKLSSMDKSGMGGKVGRPL